MVVCLMADRQLGQALVVGLGLDWTGMEELADNYWVGFVNGLVAVGGIEALLSVDTEDSHLLLDLSSRVGSRQDILVVMHHIRLACVNHCKGWQLHPVTVGCPVFGGWLADSHSLHLQLAAGNH